MDNSRMLVEDCCSAVSWEAAGQQSPRQDPLTGVVGRLRNQQIQHEATSKRPDPQARPRQKNFPMYVCLVKLMVC